MNTEIALQKLRYEIEYLKEAEADLKREYISIQQTIYQLNRMETPGIKELVRKLRRQNESLDKERNRLKGLRMTLEQIVRLYRQCEDQIMNEEFDYKKQNIWFRSIDVSNIGILLKQNQIFFK
ncbi:MAG: hypothetical protein MRZ63_11470 [Anaerostipes sp.]|uniref:hypothetical protein n=1 Tax=Anaerostipes sp. 992a TaxID=1261637 RepID=UPI0009517668|nr:hypothetical protein [Anaerostipes sp. 992a]MCI5952905.1 hypothetical protein [Anaerostipes sp.]MDD5969107.1 hypothetical protein [Anaerostipes sp.]OLR62759.1 hypothetical protein BHF69_08735 [Anaerostipes sp. 992a]